MIDKLEGNKIIGEHIQANKPFSIIRLRDESDCLEWYLTGRYPKVFNTKYEVNGGLFPLERDIFDFYCEKLKRGIETCDYAGYWKSLHHQYTIYSKKVKKIKTMHNRCLEPFYHQDPWSQYLEGKTVLIIHPFTDSIEMQYSKRHLLWENPKVLPEFQLKALKAEQTSAGESKRYNNWIDSLNSMIDRMRNIDFDIALIGCGCYDIPLAYEIKNINKQAIVVGGGLQLLFGIKGSRWDRYSDIIPKFYNKHWVRPTKLETPTNNHLVENGCYW